MKLKTTSLIKALASLSSIVGKRSTMPVLSHVFLESANGKLTLSASDIDQYKSESIECDGDIEPVCVSHAKLTACLFSNVETTELDLNGQQLVIKCGSKATLSTLPAEGFVPKPADKNTKAIGCINTDLAQGINEVLFCVLKKQENPTLQSVHISGDAGGIYCDAYDRYNAALSTKLSMCGDFNIMVMSGFASELSESLNQPNAVFKASEKHAIVEHDNGFYACKQTDGTFPAIRAAMKESRFKRTKLGLSPVDKICDALNTCINLSDKAICPKVSMSWSKEGLRIEFMDSNSSFDTTIDGQFTKHSHMINANSLLMCLNQFKGKEALFEFVENGIAISCGDLLVMSSDLKA